MFITDPWYNNPLVVEIADLYVVDKTCNYTLPGWSEGRHFSKRLLNDLNESKNKGNGCLQFIMTCFVQVILSILNKYPYKAQENKLNENQNTAKSDQPDQTDKCNSKCQAEFLGKLKKVGKKELARKFGKCMRTTVS